MVYLLIDVLKKFIRVFGLAGLFRLQPENHGHTVINFNSPAQTPQIVSEENPESIHYLINTGSD